MSSLLSNLADNLAEENHQINCKNCDFFLEKGSVEDNLIKHKCQPCHKFYSDNLDQELKTWFQFKFSSDEVNKFILLLRKVYPYDYTAEW